MSVETANFPNQLDENLPASTDFVSEGDNHLRLIKKVFKTTFPNVAGAANATHTELNLLVGLTGGALASQLSGKANKSGADYSGTHNFSGATQVQLPANTSIGGVDAAELATLDGVNAALQGQFDAKANKAGDSYTGTHNFSGATVAVATAAPGDSSSKPASTAFASSLAMNAALPGQSGSAGKVIQTDGVTAGWVAPVFPLAGPSALSLIRSAGVLTGVYAVVDGDDLNVILTRASGNISSVQTIFRGKTKTDTFNRDGAGTLTGITSVVT